MFPRIALTLGWLRRLATSRSDLLIENLALRHQLAIFTAKRPRPRMRVAAPDFHERLGYAVVGRFESHDGHGHAKLFLTRTIA